MNVEHGRRSRTSRPDLDGPVRNAGTMSKKRGVDLPGAATYGPYTPGVSANGVLWLSGQIAPEAGGVAEQVAASLAKIDALLHAAGCSKHDVTFAQVLLADIQYFATMNEAYAAWLDGVDVKPARAAFQAAALPAGAAVEIVVQAALP